MLCQRGRYEEHEAALFWRVLDCPDNNGVHYVAFQKHLVNINFQKDQKLS